MSDPEAHLTELERRSEEADSIEDAIRLSQELYDTLIRYLEQPGALTEEQADDWFLRAVHQCSSDFTLSAIQERMDGNAALGRANAERALRFLEETGCGTNYLKIDRAYSCNTLSWALIEQGHFREALEHLGDSQRILTGILGDADTRDAFAELPPESHYHTAALFSGLGDSLYNEAGARGSMGAFGRALQLNEQAADYALIAVETAPEVQEYQTRLQVIIESLVTNMNTFGGWFQRRRLRKKFGL